MIAKVPDADRPTDPRNAAGLSAEQTMAFYLRRAFGHQPHVFVFNDLRLEHEREVAQIDHLVLHRGGMVIVESKSVRGEVVVNEHGEWARRSGSHHEGMPSPVLQARRQESVLRALLFANSERLRDRMFMGAVQARFNRHWPIDILVAVSDQGRITRRSEVPELRKADQVADTIVEIVDAHAHGRRSLNPLNSAGDIWLSAAEMGRLVQFLLSRHTPQRGRGRASVRRNPSEAGDPATVSAAGVSAAADSASMAPPAGGVGRSATTRGLTPDSPGDAKHRCRHCGSTDLHMRYARTSRPYYFRCAACGGDTAADWRCTACGADARIRKRGPEYSRVCGECGFTAHIFTNPADAPSD